MRCFAYTSTDPVVPCPGQAAIVIADQHFCGFHGEQIILAVGGRWVYFAYRRDHVKIGVSDNPAQRVVQLGAELIATEVGNAAREAALHRQFDEHRTVGEWFEPGPDLVAYVEGLSGRALPELSAAYERAITARVFPSESRAREPEAVTPLKERDQSVA